MTQCDATQIATYRACNSEHDILTLVLDDCYNLPAGDDVRGVHAVAVVLLLQLRRALRQLLRILRHADRQCEVFRFVRCGLDSAGG